MPENSISNFQNLPKEGCGQTVHIPDGTSDQTHRRWSRAIVYFGCPFYPGAKIGIIGHNGAGKSTILRIMAGIDTEFDGHVWLDQTQVGYLRQEPELDPNLTVRQNVERIGASS